MNRLGVGQINLHLREFHGLRVGGLQEGQPAWAKVSNVWVSFVPHPHHQPNIHEDTAYLIKS